MARRLYLDTARLGLMSPSAQRIHIDFARFAGEEAASLYFDDLLRQGADAWPESLRQRHPALSAWRGIPHFKAGLKRLAGASPESDVLVASRPAQLMKLAAELLARACRNVLVVDLCWPNYLRILRRRMRMAGGRLTTVPIRHRLFRDRIDAKELAAVVAHAFVGHRCDGLFLPAVDNLGVRLPISSTVEVIKARAEIPFIVVDGAQAFCQVPVELRQGYCDFFLAGAHKWLRAYHPLGLAFYGDLRSEAYIKRVRSAMLNGDALNDPLLRYGDQLEYGVDARYGETVALSPLFTCQGAVDDALANGLDHRRDYERCEWLLELAGRAGWTPIFADDSLYSRIKLLKSPRTPMSRLSPAQLRRQFHDARVAISAYSGGLVRVSLPDRPWTDCDSERLSAALLACNALGRRTRRNATNPIDSQDPPVLEAEVDDR